MTRLARVRKLEETLPPEQAVLLWLADAHAFGSLPAYLDWLIDQPPADQPIARVAEQARASVRDAPRGGRAATEERAELAGREAAFLVQVTVEVNVRAAEALEIGALTARALTWQMRCLTLEQVVARDQDDGDELVRCAKRLAEWAIEVRAYLLDLYADDIARSSLAARFLGGRPMLWPDLAADAAALLEKADQLPEASDLFCPDEGADAASLRHLAEGPARARARSIVGLARARVLAAAGDDAGAAASVEPLLRRARSARSPAAAEQPRSAAAGVTALGVAGRAGPRSGQRRPRPARRE